MTSDTGYNRRDITSVVDPVTFTPNRHSSENPKTGSESYSFYDPGGFTDDPVAHTGREKNKQLPVATTFNREPDLETFAMLPLLEGTPL